jgi:hypothetical protein
MTLPKSTYLRLAVIAAVAITGYGLVTLTQAATHAINAEAEQATIAGTAAKISDSTASAGSALNFGGQQLSTVRFFAALSPLNRPIPANPVIDPKSAAIVSMFGSYIPTGSFYEFGAPTFVSSPTDPAYNLTVTEPWGANPYAAYNPVRIPDAATKGPGSDGWQIIIDPVRRLVFNQWQAQKVNGQWRASWGGVFSLDDMGIKAVSGGGVASGISKLGGQITIKEVQQGQINHALAFVTNCNGGSSTNFRYPASSTDGPLFPPNCPVTLEQGMRFQLDPAVNCDGLAGATNLEKMICRAMQTYGAYDVDNGGSHEEPPSWGGFYFEGDDMTDPARVPPNKPGNGCRPGGVYNVAGCGWDYQNFPHIPWNRIRVLKQWDGM